jgi:hypothetical protein
VHLLSLSLFEEGNLLQTVKELVSEVARLEAVREEREQQLFAWRDDIFNILGW